ncbi:TcpD family membrane protein [Streptomyces olivaceus]|uniref:TcpD family membrane protein n=1 Tax=Streptomyces olivaceus TaxID=47716 RepID=UPI0036F6F531
MSTIHDVSVIAAALTDGSDLKDWVLLVVGNLFAAFLGVRGFRHFVKDDWGGMITMAVAAVFVAGLVWFPDQVKNLLSGVWDKVMG